MLRIARENCNVDRSKKEILSEENNWKKDSLVLELTIGIFLHSNKIKMLSTYIYIYIDLKNYLRKPEVNFSRRYLIDAKKTYDLR